MTAGLQSLSLGAFLSFRVRHRKELLPPQLFHPSRRDAPLLPLRVRRALVPDPDLACSVFPAVQGVDAAKRASQSHVAHKRPEAAPAREHNILHHKRALALVQAALNVLPHIGVHAGGRAPLIRGRGETLGQGSGIKDCTIRTSAERVAHIEDGVTEERDRLRGPGLGNDLALAHRVHVRRARASHPGQLAEARVDAGRAGALDELGLELCWAEAEGGAAAVVEVGNRGAGAEHHEGFLGLDGVRRVPCCEGGQWVLPGREHDVLVAWAEGL